MNPIFVFYNMVRYTPMPWEGVFIEISGGFGLKFHFSVGLGAPEVRSPPEQHIHPSCSMHLWVCGMNTSANDSTVNTTRLSTGAGLAEGEFPRPARRRFCSVDRC